MAEPPPETAVAVPPPAWLSEITEPISEAEPTGGKVDYHDDYLAVKAEIDRLESVDAADTDYRLIVDRSRKLLREASKDLRVAGYLTIGLAQTEAWTGMHHGLAAVGGLVDTYWDDLHPPARRMQARMNALQFLARRLKLWMEEAAVAEADGPRIEAALALVETLYKQLIETLGREEADRSDLFGLVQNLKNAQRRVPKPAPKPELKPEPKVAAAAPAPGAPAAAVPRAPAPGGDGAAADWTSAADAHQTLLRVRNYLREKDGANPLSYRLVRMVRWDGIRQEPVNDGGRMPLEGPPVQRRTYLAGLLERSDYATLAEEAEKSFGEMPLHFWLDLQRFVATALERRGAAFAGAAEAVLQETALLLRRVPGLTKLAYMDGTPFADHLTKAWIDARIKPLFAGGESDGPGAGGGEADKALAEAFKKARDEVVGGSLPKGLKALRDGAAGDADERTRFRRQLYVAKLCLQGGRPEVAQPILERLDEAAAHHGLDRWEPALALEVWADLYQCYRQQGEEAAGSEPARAVFARICRQDAAYAVARFGEKGG